MDTEKINDLIDEIRRLVDTLGRTKTNSDPPSSSTKKESGTSTSMTDKSATQLIAALGILSSKLGGAARNRKEEIRAANDFANSVTVAAGRAEKAAEKQAKKSEDFAKKLNDAADAAKENAEQLRLASMSAKQLAEEQANAAKEARQAANTLVIEQARSSGAISKGQAAFAEGLSSSKLLNRGFGILGKSGVNLGTNSNKLAGGLNIATAAFRGLSRGATQYGTEMAAGTLQAGGVAQSFGSVVNSVTSVTKSFGPWGFALSTAADALMGFAIAAAKQGDLQAEAFESLAAAGANTTGGLGDINKMLDQFGLHTKDAGKAIALIASNAPALALYAGNAAEGAKAFAGVQGMIADSGLRRELKLMGIGYEQQRQGQMAYMSVMSRAGLSQGKTVKELAAGAAEYLKEQDRLTRATGATAAEQEAARNAALAEEQFRTRNYRLSQGTEEEKEQAKKELNTYNLISQMAGKDAARQFGASLDGIVTDINKGSAILTNGAMQNIAQRKDMSSEDQADAVVKVLKDAMRPGGVGDTLGKTGQFQATFGMNQNELLNALAPTATPSARLAAAGETQTTLVKDPAKNVKDAVDTAENAITSMRNLQNATQIGVDAMQSFGSKLTWLNKKLTGLLPKDESVGGNKMGDTASNLAISAVPGGAALKWLYDKIPGYAVGGIASGDKSGHLAMLHGTEAVIPLAGGSVPVSISGGSADKGDVGSGPAFSKANEFAAQMDKVIKALDDSNKYLSDIYDEISGGATVGGAGSGSGSSERVAQEALAEHDHAHPHEPAAAASPELAAQIGKIVMPLEKMNQTSGFGNRMMDGKVQGHGAIDLAGKIGDKVMAPISGIARVLSEKESGGYGNMVEVTDSVTGVKHMLAHLDKSMVKSGDVIKAGQQIGTLGNTGKSTGAHLHHEMRDKQGNKIDPSQFYSGPGFGSTAGGAATGNPQAARRGQKSGATQAGAPTDMATYMKTVAMLESGGDPNAKAGTNNGVYSSAGGLFQFLESSYEGVTGRKGSGAERFDPAKATEAMQKLTMMNKGQMEKGLGREVSGEDLYMGHFLGAGGATKFLKAKDQDPNQSAAKFDPTAAASNKSIYYDQKNNNRERSVAEVHSLMTEKYRKQQAAIQGGAKLPDVVAALGTGGMPLAGGAAPTTAVARAAPTTAVPGAPTATVPGYAPEQRAQPAAQPTTLAGIAQNLLGGLFGSSGTTAGIAGPTAPAAGSDMAGITAALQAQTAATQSAITSSMENMTTRLVASLGTPGGISGGDPAVPALLGDIASAQREQTAAINRLISVQTA